MTGKLNGLLGKSTLHYPLCVLVNCASLSIDGAKQALGKFSFSTYDTG